MENKISSLNKFHNDNEKLIQTILGYIHNNNLESNFIINSNFNLNFKNCQYLYENKFDIKLEKIGLKEILNLREEIEKSNKNFNIYSLKFDIQNPIYKPIQYLNNLIDPKLVSHSLNKSFYLNIFIYHLDPKKQQIFLVNIQNTFVNLIRNGTLQLNERDFVISIYSPDKKLDEIMKLIKFEINRCKKIISYDPYNKDIKNILKSIGVFQSFEKQESHLIITDKFENILYNDIYDLNKMVDFIISRDKNILSIENKKEENFSYELKKSEFEKLIFNLDNLFKQTKIKSLFEKNTTDLKIKIRQENNFTNNNLITKYYIDNISDFSVIFYDSFIHRNFYNTIRNSLDENKFNPYPKLYKRFKSKDRIFLKEAKDKYNEILRINDINDKSIIIKKRWNFSLGRIENNYKIYNEKGITISPNHLEKLEECQIMREEIQKEIKKISTTLNCNFKTHKKLQKKNLSIPSDEGELWENQIGKRYLIYFNFAEIDDDTLVNVSNFIHLNNKYTKSYQELNLNFLIMIQSSEINESTTDLEDLIKDFHHLILDDFQIMKMYNYVNPFDSELSHCYIYIDLEGNIFPFDERIENNLEEKLLSMIYPKFEINFEEYKLLKSYIKNFYCEYFLSNREYNYRFSLNTFLEKNEYFDEFDEIKKAKFYIRGKLRIRDIDYLNEEKETFSVFNYFDEISSILKNHSDPIQQIFKNKNNLETFNIPEKSNCNSCKSILGNFGIYFCYFCNCFYCRDCVKNNQEEFNSKCCNQCLIIIVDYEKTKIMKNLNNLEKEKITLTSSDNTGEKYSIGYCCSNCDQVKYDRRYICFICRGCDIVMSSNDSNSNGFVEFCEECFEFLSSYYEDENFDKKELAENSLEKIKDRECHDFDSHPYIFLKDQTNSYLYY